MNMNDIHALVQVFGQLHQLFSVFRQNLHGFVVLRLHQRNDPTVNFGLGFRRTGKRSVCSVYSTQRYTALLFSSRLPMQGPFSFPSQPEYPLQSVQFPG